MEGNWQTAASGAGIPGPRQAAAPAIMITESTLLGLGARPGLGLAPQIIEFQFLVARSSSSNPTRVRARDSVSGHRDRGQIPSRRINKPSLPNKVKIPNAGSCTRLLTPPFLLYRFVVSRTSRAEYICPFLLERPGSSKPGRPKL